MLRVFKTRRARPPHKPRHAWRVLSGTTCHLRRPMHVLPLPARQAHQLPNHLLYPQPHSPSDESPNLMMQESNLYRRPHVSHFNRQPNLATATSTRCCRGRSRNQILAIHAWTSKPRQSSFVRCMSKQRRCLAFAPAALQQPAAAIRRTPRHVSGRHRHRACRTCATKKQPDTHLIIPNNFWLLRFHLRAVPWQSPGKLPATCFCTQLLLLSVLPSSSVCNERPRSTLPANC